MDPVTSYVETDNLKSIKVLHGTAGSINGSTIGGSLDLLLIEPDLVKTDTFNISVGTGYSTVSRSTYNNAILSINRKNWATKISGIYRKSNSYKDGNGDIVPFTQYEKYNFHSSTNIYINEKSKLKLDFIYDDALDVGYPSLPMDVGLDRKSVV